LAAEIDNKFKLRCLKVRYSPKASARTEAGRFGRERIQRGRQAQLALPLRPDKLCIEDASLSNPIFIGAHRRPTGS
jgi:hypothetical protein